MRPLHIALAQINVTVAHLQGNPARIPASLRAPRAQRSRPVVFREQIVTGYPSEHFLAEANIDRGSRLWYTDRPRGDQAPVAGSTGASELMERSVEEAR